MNIQESLLSLPCEEWAVDQAVVFDWFDGPRHGVVRLAKPECEFAFEVLAERYNPDGLDDRLFRVCGLPAGSVAEVLTSIRSLGAPANVVWVPVWSFESEEQKLRADRRIDDVLSRQESTGLVIYTRDLLTYLGCWRDDRAGEEIGREWERADRGVGSPGR
jgi:hypothetical protein